MLKWISDVFNNTVEGVRQAGENIAMGANVGLRGAFKGVAMTVGGAGLALVAATPLIAPGAVMAAGGIIGTNTLQGPRAQAAEDKFEQGILQARAARASAAPAAAK